MSSSDKRRGGSTSHTNNTLRSSAASTRSSSSNVIAPPPPARLGSRSSSPRPGTDNDGGGSGSSSSRGAVDSDRISIASTLSKDTTTTSAREKDAAAATSQAQAQAQAQLLREKDDKIAELQRELVQLEAEFVRQVELLSQNESETAAFWQAKHSGLNQQFLRTDTELRLLRAEADAREAERAALHEGRELLRRELRDRDDELRRLRALNRGLKEQVSTSTRAVHEQTSDEQFGDDMARLGNGLQNWIIVHFRKAKIDLAKTNQPEVDELAQLVPMYAELASKIKIHLLQSIVSSVLVDGIFSQYFVGLSEEQSSKFNEMERFLSSTSSDATVNQWRAMTLNMMRKDSSSPSLQSQTDVVVDNIISRLNRLLDSITADAGASEARDQSLRALVTSAVVLSRQLAVQKAVFKVTMPYILPHQTIPFDAAEMEDIGGEDEEDLASREICCVTCPSIVKFGDEHGGNPQLRNVIAKARVLCSPE
ncbi:hypothetical protein PG994_001990 [Apiospora phragmitis]|uniref:Uncharacterized protein n=1 Tax=Apiospora phragmitis TaxID=2905665 RepID=A0ABR1WV44_9PEZI